MKISYNFGLDNLFKQYHEQYYVLTYHKKILKKKFFGNIKFLTINVCYLFIMLICLFLWLLLAFKYDDFSFFPILVISVCGICILFLLLLIFLFVLGYFGFKKRFDTNNNTLIVDKNGITDNMNHTSVSFKWDSLSSIIIGEYSIFIFSVKKSCLVFPINIKDKLLLGIEKYNVNNELVIINKEYL